MLDSLYARVMRVRRRRYEREPGRQRRLAQPVISVGNLSVGGTGKTPVVAALAQWLAERGERPAILSRGYARADAADGVVVVSDGAGVRASIDRAGDEPMMLARQVPRAIVCVSPERYLSGVLAERELGATVHILDDGFQHLDLARDLDVLVTTVGEVSSGKVLPVGRLREPRDAAARAHVLVVSDATAETAAAEAAALGIAQGCAAMRALGAPVKGSGIADQGSGIPDVGLQIEDLGSPRVLAVAGIAHPDRFFAALTTAGWNVVDTIAFADHHRYSARDLSAIAERYKASGATAVFTTEKDAVRFEAAGELPVPLHRVPLNVTFDPDDVLFDAVDTALRSSSARARELRRNT